MKKFLLLLCLFVVGQLAAQSPYAIHFDVQSGLPSNNVFCVFQDSRQFIWLATDEGLCRYDGVSFKPYYCIGQTSKAGSYIQEDYKGRIWYSSFDGVLYYVENDSLHRFQGAGTVSFRFGVYKTRLVCVNKEGLCIVNLKTMKVISTVKLNPTRLINVNLIDSFYYLISDTLKKYDMNGRLLASLAPDPHKIIPTHIASFGSRVLLADIENRTRQVAELVTGKILPAFSMPDVQIVNYISAAGQLWVCTNDGALAYNKSFQRTGHYFGGKKITQVLQDASGNHWFSTENDGLYLVPSLENTFTTLPQSRPSSLCETKAGLLIGTKTGQIFKKTGNTISLAADMGLQREIYDLMPAGQPLRPLDKRYGNTLPVIDGSTVWYANSGVKSLVQLPGGFVATANSGNIEIIQLKTHTSDGRGWQELSDSLIAAERVNMFNCASVIPGIRAKQIVYDDAQNALFTCSNLGVFKITPTAIQEIMQGSEHIYAARIQLWQGALVMLCHDGALLQANEQGKITVMETGLQGLRCIKVLNNRLFAATNSGAYVFEQHEKGLQIRRLISFAEQQNVNDMELSAGQLVLALDKGLLSLDVNAEQKIMPLPRFVLNYFKANEQEFVNTPPNELAHWQNDIELSYALPVFSYGSNIPVFYKINNGHWQPVPENSRTLRLASLSPGSYAISFKALDYVESDWVSFVILKPWWLQTWFVVLCIVLIGIMFYFIYRWRIRINSEQNRLAIEKIRLEKDLRQSMLSSIKSQMNPHFFFNALNTLQAYIVTDDKARAGQHLQKLSSLTRTILEMSDRETVSLSQEIQALQLYIELEQSRFPDLQCSLSVDKTLLPDEIEIPAMIIQPYVENAIKHGLLHKKGDRRLSLAFHRHAHKYLCITIDDNGVGRRRSAELNRIKNKDHRSFSTSANQTRMELISQNDPTVGVSYTDKPNDGGTTVEIILPISQ